MPGLETHRFVNISQTEQDELTCGICFGILIKPMVTSCCRQTYCKECISEWLKSNNNCPNDRQRLDFKKLSKAPRLVINMLNKLQIKCEYIENGCNAVITLESLNQHLYNCRYNPECICIDCGLKNGSFNEHNCIENLKNCILSEYIKKKESDEKINLFKSKVSKLKEICHNLKNQLESYAIENQRLIQSKTDLKKENFNYKNNIERYNSKISRQLKHIKLCEQIIIELNNELHSVKITSEKAIESKNNIIINLETSVNESNLKVLAKTNEIEECAQLQNSQFVAFSKKIESLDRQIKDLKQIKSELDAFNIKLHGELKSKTILINLYKSQIRELNIKLIEDQKQLCLKIESTEQIYLLKDKVRELKYICDYLDNKVDSLMREGQRLNKLSLELKSQNFIINCDVERYKSNLAKQLNLLNEYKQNITDLTNKLESDQIVHKNAIQETKKY